ncbi:MAG TPA: hypothetical protein VKY19_05355 [Ktedonosporobacter sp.]|nr:hypothetical protein [Ktedonosporobacter sp.]
MELRSYATIIWRRLWVIALVVGIVAIYAGYQYLHLRATPGALKAYQSSTTIRIGLEATAQSTDQFYSDYIATSETLADELVTGGILTSPEFTTQVSRQIQGDLGQIHQRFGTDADLGDWQNPATIGSSLTAARFDTLVNINVTWSTQAGAWAIANAVGEVSATQMSTYLDYEVRNTPTFSQPGAHPPASAKVVSAASDPVLVGGPSANRPTLLLVLLLVALIIGIALAFLIDYLDDRIRSKAEAIQVLQLPIYGEIPRTPPAGQRTPHSTPTS